MIRTIVATFGTRTFVGLGNLGLSLALARVLGPERQGAVSYMLVLVNLMALLGGLGLDATAVVFLNRLGLATRRYVRTVLPVLLATVGLLFLAVLFLLRQDILGDGPHQTPGLFALALLMVPLEMGILLTRALLLARERIREYNRVEWVQALLLYGLVGAVLALGPPGLEWVLGMYLASRVLAAGLLVAVIRRSPLDVPGPAPSSPPALGQILGYSVWPWLANVFSLLYTRVDTLMIAWFATRAESVGSADLGLYTVSTLAVARLQDVQTAIQVSFFPHVAGLGPQEAVRATGRFYRFSTPLYWLVFGAVILAGWPALWLFGPEYTRAYPILLVLAAGILAVRANSGVLSLYFTAQGRPAVPALVNAASVVVAAALNLVLIPRWGILGAALGTLGACLTAKGLLVLVYLGSGGRYRRDLWVHKADLGEAVAWVRARQFPWGRGKQ